MSIDTFRKNVAAYLAVKESRDACRKRNDAQERTNVRTELQAKADAFWEVAKEVGDTIRDAASISEAALLGTISRRATGKQIAGAKMLLVDAQLIRIDGDQITWIGGAE